MSILKQFTTKQNLILLWNVLIDELCINSSNITLMNNIKTVFDSNIEPFFKNANNNNSLMQLNKQFLSQVVLAVNRLFPQLNQMQGQDIKRITITDEEITEPYKIEDIHASRQTNFEKQVELKKVELENYMSPQRPTALDFSDKNMSNGLNMKITEMGPLLADKIAERNLDIEMLHNTNYNSSNSETWLKTQETSIKNEKNIVKNEVKNEVKNSSRLKYLNIDSNGDISVSNKTQKKVSWNKEETTTNIFQKLKKNQSNENSINETTSNETTSNETSANQTSANQTSANQTSANQTNQYIEQKSMLLPDIKQEVIQRNIPSVNSSIIPNNDFIKYLNDMNSKIDSLCDVVTKLTYSMQELLLDKHNNTNNNNIDNTDNEN